MYLRIWFILSLLLLCLGLYEAKAQTSLTPIPSTAAESSHILKAAPGRLYSLVATNTTATTGFVVVLNATAVPADGAITPVFCIQLAPNTATTGSAFLFLSGDRPAAFNQGIVVVLTSATTCFTKTTGVITGHISGMVD